MQRVGFARTAHVKQHDGAPHSVELQRAGVCRAGAGAFALAALQNETANAKISLRIIPLSPV
jgi:hypothetical protein